MNSKKARERAALEYLYDGVAFKMEDAERPDFILTAARIQAPFGVEVTDLYDSDVEARLDRIPNYAIDLIKGAPFRHQSDRDSLHVDDVVFTSPDGTRKVSGRAVGFDPPSFADHVAQLETAISEKNEKARNYRSNLRDINLIVVDRTDRLWNARPDDLYPLLFTEALRNTVAKSPFHEISLITRIAEKRTVYVPLRMYFLVGCAYQFESALSQYAPSLDLPSRPERLRRLHGYFQSAGIASKLLKTESAHELRLGNAGVRWGEADNLLVHDYADEEPIAESMDAWERGPWTEPGFETAFLDYRQANTFLLTVAFDVRPITI